MDYADTLAELNIALGDTDNVTFTPEEKGRALTKAWNNSYVVKIVWDTTLTFAQDTYQYTVPTTLKTIKDIYITRSNSDLDKPEKIDRTVWEVVDGKLQFKRGANNIIPDGYTLYLKGNYKYDPTADTIDDTTLQEYVIALAGYETLSLLGYKKANLFLKNDTTMSEVIALRREFKQDVRELKGALTREFESV